MVFRKSLFTLTLLAGVITLITGCLTDKCERTQQYVRYDPVYLTEDGMRVDVVVHGPQDLKTPGNFNYYKNYLLVNEFQKGIHVIDNSDPGNPQNISFIEIPGNRDIAVQNDILYADMFIDLVAIDISDIMNPKVECRIEDVFQNYYVFTEGLGYVVEFIPSDVIETIDCSSEHWGSWWWSRSDVVFISNEFDPNLSFDATAFAGQTSGAGTAPTSTGVAGSMARFTLAKNHLYTLDQSEMHVFDVQSACPQQGNSVEMRWGIETLFPYGDYLYVGSNNGMLIYDNSNPSAPEYLSELQHAQACDPVFVSGDIAYVTLRDGTPCENFINQLDVVDVSDPGNPQLMTSYAMTHPHGLSVVDKTLYLCEGDAGFKIFDAMDSYRISSNLLSHIQGLHAFDVIVLPAIHVAMVIGEDGVYQYDIADPVSPKALSMIPISR